MRMTEDILHVIAKNIKAERKKKKLSQEALAEKADVHRTYIGMLERAEKNVTMLSLSKIADALGMDIADLFRSC